MKPQTLAAFAALFVTAACNNAGLTAGAHIDEKNSATRQQAFKDDKSKKDADKDAKSKDPKGVKGVSKPGTDGKSGSSSSLNPGTDGVSAVGPNAGPNAGPNTGKDPKNPNGNPNGPSTDDSGAKNGKLGDPSTDSNGQKGTVPGQPGQDGGQVTTRPPAPKMTLSGPLDNFCFNDRSEDAGTNFGIAIRNGGVIVQFYAAQPGNEMNQGPLVYTMQDPAIGLQIANQVVSRQPVSVSFPLPAELKPGSCYFLAFYDKSRPGALNRTYVASADKHGNDDNDFSLGYLNAAQNVLDDNRPMIGISSRQVCMDAAGNMNASMLVMLADTNNRDQLYENACDDDNHISPVVVNFSDAPIALSANRPGTAFDLDANGKPERVSWPQTADVCFLVMDRNKNGQIDDGRELFGNYTPGKDGKPRANGFDALKTYKDQDAAPTSCALAVSQGLLSIGETGNYLCDGDPDAADLRFWCDANADGKVGPGEIQTLASRHVSAIALGYDHIKGVDAFGNETRESSHAVGLDAKGQPSFFHSFDVWFYVDRSAKP